jgi:hypothetical protein
MDAIAARMDELMDAILEVHDGEVRKRRVRNSGELSAELRGMAYVSALLRNPFVEEVEETINEVREELMDKFYERHNLEDEL